MAYNEKEHRLAIIEAEWDEGVDNEDLDPGETFQKLVDYCDELEKEIKELKKNQAS